MFCGHSLTLKTVLQVHSLPHHANFNPWIWMEEPKTCIDLNLFGLTCYKSSSLEQLGAIGDDLKSMAKNHVMNLLDNKNCWVEFKDAMRIEYLVVSSIPILEKEFQFDAKFTYECGYGEQSTICKNFHVEVKMGELKNGLANPKVKFTSVPDRCEPDPHTADTLLLWNLN